MCRWLAYRGEPIYLETLLFEPEYSLIEQSMHARKSHVATNGDGFGIGWFSERETPGTYKEVLPAWNDHNLRMLAHQIRSPLFFAHVRASTGTATTRSNCHPFTWREWMFMHNGQIGGYEKVRRSLENLIPDALFTHRQGTTDSEAVFLLMLANGLESDPAASLAKTIGQVCALQQKAGVSEPFKMTASLSDGKRLISVRYSSDETPPSLYWCDRDGRLMVVSEPLDRKANRWKVVPPQSVLLADASGPVSIHPLHVMLPAAAE